MLQQSMFETAAEARARAKELVAHYEALHEAPEAIAVRKYQHQLLAYFIEKSSRCALDMNDHDGLQREVGALEDILTDRECRQMRRNKRIWKPVPRWWVGWRKGQTYPAQLHPKEVEHLASLQKEVDEELAAIQVNVPIIQELIAKLRMAGPLPERIASTYKLTVDGREQKGDSK